ncbi:malto-oligosyltrehalose trehalohydrolase [Hansschlegelia plantiphila]|uniref:Malto-oligosyltrehalose trehalohydrolase n=1 Tax=Hansschlegelia plantiphila TaxID=374655 RepID=A0A9W6J159_9HYPH|nr:malto-oligosyltrehalose trehalohydrolase [Hansschlegelia plantiphila]GLK67370.1 malto-oligosyltrehalose trehalohydrolase [Hansschlegelia plantiphila]
MILTASFERRLPFGAAFSDSGTTFRFWALAHAEVRLEIRDRDPVLMERDAQGWFSKTIEAPAGARYRFHLPDGLSVPDPASRFQDGDIHGWSIVIDPARYDWKTADWKGRPWHEAVVYELHVGCFGGFNGVAEALPLLAELGITAIELMPIADFPGARNWGYDGVLPYAPDAAYGSPEELKSLIDQAHELGVMMILDVVYNHFGPDGNYIPAAAPEFFREDLHTPWGGAIDFRLPEVRSYFTENVLYWLEEYRFDGLRLDAVHAISEQDWIDETAAAVRASENGRHLHLILENEFNQQSHLAGEVDAQWNDDFHHVFHVLLTGEREGYYEDFVEDTAGKLARTLQDGFVYQGDPSPHQNGKPRGTPSDHLPPTAFVSFLQNHDQIGNRAFGDRLTTLAPPEGVEAATAALLLSPHIPMIFMGEEVASETPFLFFTDHEPELAEAVRNGRRKEFAKFAAFAGAEIPDPNAVTTFENSIPEPHSERAEARTALFRKLLAIRAAKITPGIPGCRSAGADVVGEKAVVSRWTMGDGAKLTLAINLADSRVPLPSLEGTVLFESPIGAADAARSGSLPGFSTVALLEPAA